MTACVQPFIHILYTSYLVNADGFMQSLNQNTFI